MSYARQQLTTSDYPNGNTAPGTEKPCSSEAGSACCPQDWQCLDNGLCYYPPTKLHGRYSCTDKDWNSPGCPSNLCTYNMTAFGGESITQCSNHNNQWCCNADATSVDCCQEQPEPRPFFNLANGVAYATVGAREASSYPTVSTVTGAATYASGSSPTQASSAASTPDAQSSTTSSARVTADATTPVTSVATSVRSASGGSGPQTVYITSIITPTADANAAGGGSLSSGGSGPNIGLIVGCAVGIPLGLALIGILLWMLRKRRQQKAHPYKTTIDGGDSPDLAPAALASPNKKQEVYRHSRPGTSEIDSNPVGPGRPTSTIPGKAELESGAGFQPGSGTPYAPDTAYLGGGTGDRSTWGSSPPGYSPGQGQGPFAHNHEGAVELDSSMVMPVINEKSEHQPEYQAYRPPGNAVEMPTVKTPPEDVEKQLGK